MRVTTTSQPGIVVERPMYFRYGAGIDGGHAAVGVTGASPRWLFAEGYTGPGFDEYLTILNPNAMAATVRITYTLGDGSQQGATVTVEARQRRTVAVHDPREGIGRDRAVAVRVETINQVDIIVERPMYFAYQGGITGGHTTAGYHP
jgi:hypothetical protein